MRGETTGHREAVMLSEATWQAARGVRTPEWKYIRFLQPTIYGRDGVELYDLANDPDEQVNVADAASRGGRRARRPPRPLGVGPARRPARPDAPVLDAGLPAVARLNDVIAGLTRPRNDVPTPVDPHRRRSTGAATGRAAPPSWPAPVPQPVPRSVPRWVPAPPGRRVRRAGHGRCRQRCGRAAGVAAASDHLDPGAPPPTGTHRGRPVPATAVLVAAGPGSGGAVPGPPPGDGGRFAPSAGAGPPAGPARVVVALLVAVAAVVLGTAVDDLLLSSPLSAAGVVQPTEDAQLNMPTTGTISSIPVHVGEVVHAGQVLATQDTSALDARLTADQAKLTADQATLAQEQAGGQPTQVQQLQDQVAAAQTAQSSAQQKLDGVTTTTDAAVAAAQAKIRSDQALLASDHRRRTRTTSRRARRPRRRPPAAATSARSRSTRAT